jgi:hypothetical protein
MTDKYYNLDFSKILSTEWLDKSYISINFSINNDWLEEFFFNKYNINNLVGLKLIESRLDIPFLPKLEELYLSHCSVYNSIIENCSELEYINLYNTELSILPNVKKMRIGGFMKPHIKSLSKLEKLSIGSTYEPIEISNLPNLRTLKLSNIKTEFNVLDIDFTKLEKLDLYQVNTKKLFPPLVNLKKFCITSSDFDLRCIPIHLIYYKNLTTKLVRECMEYNPDNVNYVDLLYKKVPDEIRDLIMSYTLVKPCK